MGYNCSPPLTSRWEKEESGAENLCRSPKPPNVIMSCFSAVSLSVTLSLLYIEIYHPQFQFSKNLCSMKEYVREITYKCTVQISIGGTVSESRLGSPPTQKSGLLTLLTGECLKNGSVSLFLGFFNNKLTERL